jgi:uncharacterized protein DUF3786/putative Fe-S cluster protein
MVQPNGPLEILKLLDGSNCRKCGKPTCLAFAAAVANGWKRLGECPQLDGAAIQRHGGEVAARTPIEREIDESIAELKRRIGELDFHAAARRLNATVTDGRLTIRCLGKEFSVNARGNVTTEIHVNGWITMPVLDYMVDGGGVPVSGNWVQFTELKGGRSRNPLFLQRCEKPCRKLADADTALFSDILHLFGKPPEDDYSANISLVFHPLPRVPILLNYWEPEDGLESNLSILFDSTAADNLNIYSVYTLAAGLVMMFERIALGHGLQESLI